MYKVYFGLFLMFSLVSFVFGVLFFLDFSVIIELDILSLNSSFIFMSIFFYWMSLLFMSFVFVCFFNTYLLQGSVYVWEYGDLYLNRFILLVAMFVLSMMLLINY